MVHIGTPISVFALEIGCHFVCRKMIICENNILPVPFRSPLDWFLTRIFQRIPDTKPSCLKSSSRFLCLNHIQNFLRESKLPDIHPAVSVNGTLQYGCDIDWIGKLAVQIIGDQQPVIIRTTLNTFRMVLTFLNFTQITVLISLPELPKHIIKRNHTGNIFFIPLIVRLV